MDTSELNVAVWATEMVELKSPAAEKVATPVCTD